MKDDVRTIIARAAHEIEDGQVVNLGIGMPTFLASALPDDLDVVFHTENGATGLGPAIPEETPDYPVIDAGGQACRLVPGAACFDSVLSFMVVRGGRLDVAVLGAFEVSVAGDLANWMIPGRIAAGMGGGMELAQKARKVVVVSRHANRSGEPKLVPTCTLPLTAPRCVDVMITEQAVFRRPGPGEDLRLTSVHPSRQLDEVVAALPDALQVARELEPWPAPRARAN